MSKTSKAKFEVIPSAARGSFAVREFHLKKFPSGWHYHPEIELTFIVESSGRRWVGDHVTGYEAGDLVLIGSNVPHYWMNDAPSTPAEMAHSIVIQFRADCFGPKFFDTIEMRSISDLLNRAMRGVFFNGENNHAMGKKMLALRSVSGLRRFLNLIEILGELADETDFVLLSSPHFSPILDSQSVERVDRIYEYVSQRSANDFSHAELAALLGTSPSGLSHYFKRTVGCTLSSFVAEVRIGQACRHLILTERPVSEIAFISGFESLSSFNAWFRQLRGISPRAFRQSHRTGT